MGNVTGAKLSVWGGEGARDEKQGRYVTHPQGEVRIA